MDESAFEKEWIEGDRREKRVGSWRVFQEAPEAKKAKGTNFKEEIRVEDKRSRTGLPLALQLDPCLCRLSFAPRMPLQAIGVY